MHSFFRPLTPHQPLPNRQLDDMVEALCDQPFDHNHTDDLNCLGDYPWEEAGDEVS